ncbi:putative membrane protein [Catenuloplanes nepalensis]|uniref:Membrane protein n=1 Tax=Catenuloplanes nepalensis TaxID=587533 RepID=A0ABT9MRI0_9ACTN|nr:cytochrome c oxidase assembly protein [Catenuloplanes nepalensis]MDP9794025.1 putative membrane protein [Catenuloplanes nepalensis]
MFEYLPAVALIAGYLWAVSASGRRGRPWPLIRTLSWSAGALLTAVNMTAVNMTAVNTSAVNTSAVNTSAVNTSAINPGGGTFTAHMTDHLLLGMLAPLLLVAGAPVTLLLRALPAPRARTLSRILRSAPARTLTHPVTAAVLNAGGLWLLYLTPLYPLTQATPWVHAAVHAHVLAAGYLFTAALIGTDPAPHRPSFPTRAAALAGFLGAHAVLAKWLYAHPPQGVGPADAEAAAHLMYYGGELIDLVLIVLFCRAWYAAAAPDQRTRAAPDLRTRAAPDLRTRAAPDLRTRAAPDQRTRMITPLRGSAGMRRSEMSRS